MTTPDLKKLAETPRTYALVTTFGHERDPRRYIPLLVDLASNLELEVETLREEIKRLKALGLRESNRLTDERKYTRELEARLARHEEAALQETKP